MQSKNTYQKLELMLDTSDIVISVKDQHLDQMGGFITYLILGTDKLGTFEIRRRFNDFYFLREGLTKKWPGCYIPPIPSKKITGNKQDRFIQDRRRFLEYFLLKISGIKYLYYCQIFQQFLRNKSAVMQNLSISTAKCTAGELAPIYKQIFSKYLTNVSIGDLRAKINSFSVYLKKSQKQLQNLKLQIREIAMAQRVFHDNMNILNTLILPQYQKNAFSEYVNQQNDQQPYLNDNAVNQKIRQLRDNTIINPIDYLVDLIAFQLREVQGLQQAIQMKQFYEQKKRKLEDKKKNDQNELTKLLSGKTTFKSIFTRGNKNQQISTLQKANAEDQKEIQSLGVLLDYINIILGEIQITNFKNYKQTQYIEILNKVSKQSLKHLDIYGSLMKSLMIANQNIKFD